MLQIMAAFSSYVDVPEPHVRSHSAIAAAGSDPDGRQVVRIFSGQELPERAFAAVRYRDYWFWIDDGDLQTKRALTAVVFFFTLAGSGGSEQMPLITIPAQ
jgi:hypothetical protein